MHRNGRILESANRILARCAWIRGGGGDLPLAHVSVVPVTVPSSAIHGEPSPCALMRDERRLKRKPKTIAREKSRRISKQSRERCRQTRCSESEGVVLEQRSNGLVDTASCSRTVMPIQESLKLTKSRCRLRASPDSLVSRFRLAWG